MGGSTRAENIIENLAFSTGVVTPNGDGVHDQLVIDYILFRLPTPVPVVLSVYDLRGVQRGRRALGMQSAGPQTVQWDGRDAHGQLLAPGLYLVEIALESEFKTFRHLQPLGVAY